MSAWKSPRMFCYVETGRCLSKGVFRESVEASACVQEYKSDTGEDMVRVKASLAMEIELELPKEEYVALGAAGLQKFARERLVTFTKKTQLGGVSSGMGEAIERAVRSERRGLMTVTAPCGRPEDVPYMPGEAEPLQPTDGDREMGQTPETDQAPKAKKRAADEQAVPEQDETAGGADEEKEIAEQSLDASMDSNRTGGDVDMVDERSKESAESRELGLEGEKVKVVSSESGAAFEDARSGVEDSSAVETDLSRAESSAAALGSEAERAVVREAVSSKGGGVGGLGCPPTGGVSEGLSGADGKP